MDNQALHDLLHELHDRLETIGEVEDEESRQLLADILGDLQRIIQSENKEIAADDTIISRLNNGMVRLEAINPDLTLYIVKILDILSGAGI